MHTPAPPFDMRPRPAQADQPSDARCVAVHGLDGWAVLVTLEYGAAVHRALLTQDQAEQLAAGLLNYAQVCRGEHPSQLPEPAAWR